MRPSHFTHPLRHAIAMARGRRDGGRPVSPAGSGDQQGFGRRDYTSWIDLYDSPAAEEVADLRHQLGSLDRLPTISLIMPVFNPPLDLLRRAITSVQRQIYEKWELCVADDCSVDAAVPDLVDRFASVDPRIRMIRLPRNCGIAAASNASLELATGEWVAPVDHDDELAPHALAHIVLAVAGNPEAAVIYTDEDKIDARGRRHLAYFKPDFDPLLLLGQNYLAHLIAYRQDLVRKVGGYREQFDGSQDWDLTLRVTELVASERVVHVPHVLYHWRSHPGSTATGVQAKPHAVAAGRAAVTDHLSRQQAGGCVDTDIATGWHRVRWPLPDPVPHVDILIVTTDGKRVPGCMEALTERTDYPDYDVVNVKPGGGDTRALVNEAVAAGGGAIVCLLSEWCDVTAGDWLEELVGQLLRDRIGAVGGKILRPDGTVLSAGKALDFDDVAIDLGELGGADVVNEGRLRLAHHVSAVNDDMIVVRRSAWEQVRGFDPYHLPTVFGDVDLCLRLRAAGWRTVWTPHATAVHRRDARPPAVDGHAAAAGYMRRRWADELRRDPAMNPNLRASRDRLELAFPPRWPA